MDSLELGVQGRMMDLCQGRKKCVALMVISRVEDINQDPPVETLTVQQKFSLQTAWVVVKRLAKGYMVRLSCSARSRLWLQYGSMVSEEIRGKTNHDLNQQIFEVHKNSFEDLDGPFQSQKCFKYFQKSNLTRFFCLRAYDTTTMIYVGGRRSKLQSIKHERKPSLFLKAFWVNQGKPQKMK